MSPVRGNASPIRYFGIGLRRRKANHVLDVHFPLILPLTDQRKFAAGDRLLKKLGATSNQVFKIGYLCLKEKDKAHLKKFVKTCLLTESISDLAKRNILDQILKSSKARLPESYYKTEVIVFWAEQLGNPIQTIEEAYGKLHLISMRLQKPHSVNLGGIFSILPNIAWTKWGPILLEDLEIIRLKMKMMNKNMEVSHVDKFPLLVNYHIPSGVRIVDGSRVRLGAYLGEGTTVMPAGFVNFNAGTLGRAMVEGRISAGVVVGHDSDLGGGASIMGTLSGGGKEVISIGEQCLIGANAGVGISLGFGCTVEAGLYLTASAKVSLFNQENQPIGLDGKKVTLGKNVFKASLFSGKEKLLYYRDSTSGRIIVKPNMKKIALNPTLHTKQ